MNSQPHNNPESDIPSMDVNAALRYESSTPLQQPDRSDVKLHRIFSIGVGVVLAIVLLSIGGILLLNYAG